MIRAFLDEAAAVSLPSVRPTVMSAWRGHVSFAHWLIFALQPAVTVELGTHNGLSYSAFCNAIAEFGLPGKCYAVDTWRGDEHAGFYGDDVYQSLDKFNRSNFGKFGTLLRCRFDEALDRFADGSVDLLHIDGFHSYEAVSNDYQTWLPKLSDRAVVLFHDTHVFVREFGVHRFFAELTERYPSFNFSHSFGLGVLAVGKDASKAILDLCASSEDEAEAIRQKFERASRLAHARGLYRISELCNAHVHHKARNVAIDCAFTTSSVGETLPGRLSAVDGRKDGTHGFHTELESNPWAILDLGRGYIVDWITVYNRLDQNCALRAQSLTIQISFDGSDWQTVYVHDGSIFGGIDGDPLRVRLHHKLRFLKLSLIGEQIFHLDQIEVYNHVEED